MKKAMNGRLQLLQGPGAPAAPIAQASEQAMIIIFKCLILNYPNNGTRQKMGISSRNMWFPVPHKKHGGSAKKAMNGKLRFVPGIKVMAAPIAVAEMHPPPITWK